MSTNDAYIPAYKYSYGRGGKRYKKMYMRKSDELKVLQESIQKAFDEEFFYKKDYLLAVSSYINNLKLGLDFNLSVSLPYEEYYTDSEDVTRNDTSNFIKAIEDGIMRGIGIDDKRNIKLTVEKGFNEDAVWMFKVDINSRSIHNRIDVDIFNAYIKQSEGDEINESE